jgi:NAD(P)-dependent dehydrogenase (short-subunit alcohol dehydrogenase family)
MEEITSKDFNEANSINLTGSFLLARSVAKKMYQGGSIVMFSSMYGIVSPNPSSYPDDLNPNPIEYGVGKAGLLQMTRYLASYYGKKNIRVNAVAPGPFPNKDKESNDNSVFLDNLKKSTMLGRLGDSSETAGPIVFLLSNASSYITGHTLNIDGGWTSW